MNKTERESKMLQLIQEAAGRNANYDIEESIKLSKKAVKLASVDMDSFFQSYVLAKVNLLYSYVITMDVSNAKKMLNDIMGEIDICESSIYIPALIACSNAQKTFLWYDEAERSIQKALGRAREYGLAQYEAEALMTLGTIKRTRYRFNEALLLMSEAYDIAVDGSFEGSIFDIIMEKAVTLAAIGDYYGALSLFKRIEKEAFDRGHEPSVEKCLVHQVDIYRSVGDIDKACRIEAKLLEWPDTLHIRNPEYIKVIGALRISRGLYTEALDHYDIAMDIVTRLRAHPLLPIVYQGYCTVYQALGNHSNALESIWRAIGHMEPDFVFHREVLGTLLDQLSFSQRAVHDEKYSDRLSALAGKLKELSFTGIGESQFAEAAVQVLNEDIGRLFAEIRHDAIQMFAIRGVRVDLKQGFIYKSGTTAVNKLPPIQKAIFKLLVKNQGSPVSNLRIIKCYEERAEVLEGNPRRAQYFIHELRKRLGANDIIRSVKGCGYMIPRL